MNSILKLEIERHDWNKLGGTAKNIPKLLEKLFSSGKLSEKLYWSLEYSITRDLETMEPLIPILLISLLEKYPKSTKTMILELLFQILILVYDDNETEDKDVPSHIMEYEVKCKKKYQEGIGILYHELVYGEQEAAMEILELIETDKERLNYYIEKLKIPPIVFKV